MPEDKRLVEITLQIRKYQQWIKWLRQLANGDNAEMFNEIADMIQAVIIQLTLQAKEEGF